MKTKTLQIMLAIALTAVMSVSVLSGCGNSTEESKGSQASSEEVSAAQSSESQSSQASADVTQSQDQAAADGFDHDAVLNELGAEPICKEKVTITIGIKNNANVQDYETNHYTKMLEEVGNVNIDFVVFPTGDEAQEKLQLMITGGEKLPDILMWGQTDALAMSWGEEGYILPLEDYFEHSSYYAAEGYARVKETAGLDIVEYMRSSDGHVWSFPTYQETLTNPTYSRLYIYYPWLEALNLEIPTTTDELYDVLYAFKTQDPNGNGVADELPIMSCLKGHGSFTWEWLMNGFVQTTGKTKLLFSENGELKAAFAQEGWKEGVKYVAKLVKDGLYDPVSFTQDNASLQAIANNSEAHLLGSFASYSTSSVVANEAKDDWLLIPPVSGPDGFASVAYNPDVPKSTAIITSYCEHPEVAFRLLDLMCREDFTITSRWGIQGENWDYVADLDEKEIEAMMSEQLGTAVDYNWEDESAMYPAYFFEYNNIWNTPQNAHWMNTAVCFRTGEITGGYNSAMMRYDDEYRSKTINTYTNDNFMKDIKDVIPKEPITKISFASIDESIEAEEIWNDINTFVYERMYSWFAGNGDVEAEWDQYLKDLETMGLSRYLELAQKCWNP